MRQRNGCEEFSGFQAGETTQSLLFPTYLRILINAVDSASVILRSLVARSPLNPERVPLCPAAGPHEFCVFQLH